MQHLAGALGLTDFFEIDLAPNPNCGGQIEVFAAIHESAVIEWILTHLGLHARAPPRTLVREVKAAQAA